MNGVPVLLGDRAVAVLFETFLHFLWQGTLVAGIAAIGLGLLRRRGPEVRYAWAVSMMALLVLLPAITGVLAARSGATPADTAAAVPAVLVETAAVSGPAGAAVEPRDPISSSDARIVHRPPLAERAAPWIVSLWLLGAAALLAWNLGGWLHLRRRLLRHGCPVDGEWQTALRRIAARLGIRRPVRLVRSDRATVPLVAGWLRPVVVLPASLLTGLPAADLEALLAHELAHVRRHDYLVNLLQIAAESALFFHPAVWWLSTRIRQERELCCDDLAAAAAGGRGAYAHSLATIAGEITGRRLVAASGGSLLARIRHLTDADPRGPLPSPWAAVALVVAIPLALALGGRAPLDADPAAGPDPAPSLFDRWDDAVEGIGTDGGWIAWGLSGPAGGSTVVSGTPGGPPHRADAPATRQVLAGVAGEERPGVILLFGFDPGAPAGDAVRHVRLREPDVPLDTGGLSVRWLGIARDDESVALLERLSAASGDPAARAEIAAALTLHGDSRMAVPAVARLLEAEPDRRVRAEAIQWLDRHAGAEVFALMRDALATDPSAEVRSAVTTSIDQPAVRDTFDVEAALLAAVFEDEDPRVREDALAALEDLPGEAAGAGIRRVATDHPDPEIREQAVQALEEIPGEDRAALLERIVFEDPAPDVREAAFHVLSDLGSPAVAGLRRIVREHPDPRMRSGAVAELEDLGTR